MGFGCDRAAALWVLACLCCSRKGLGSVKSLFESTWMGHAHERLGATAFKGWQRGCGWRLVPFSYRWEGLKSKFGSLCWKSLRNLSLKGENTTQENNKVQCVSLDSRTCFSLKRFWLQWCASARWNKGLSWKFWTCGFWEQICMVDIIR